MMRELLVTCSAEQLSGQHLNNGMLPSLSLDYGTFCQFVKLEFQFSIIHLLRISSDTSLI